MYNEAKDNFYFSQCFRRTTFYPVPIHSGRICVGTGNQGSSRKVSAILRSSFCIHVQRGEARSPFPGRDSSTCDTAFLKPGVLYYADECNGKPAHPLAGIFFITKKKQIVLVDVTGGVTGRCWRRGKVC